jgi:hypothetical protein
MTIKKNKIAKISIIFLMAVLLFLSVKYYKVSNEFKNYVYNSELETKVLNSQLDEILHKYDSLSQISVSKTDVKQSATNLNDVKSEKHFGSTEDSIVFFAKKMQNQNTAIKQQLLEDFPKTKTGNSKPELKILNASNVNAKGVKILGDFYSRDEVKIQQLRVCFTLDANETIKTGEKTIYIQVVNPKNQIISSENTSVESDANVKLQYSALVNTNYQKKDTDVCTYVNLEQKKTIKGKYKINIYHDFVKIGTAIFEY